MYFFLKFYCRQSISIWPYHVLKKFTYICMSRKQRYWTKHIIRKYCAQQQWILLAFFGHMYHVGNKSTKCIYVQTRNTCHRWDLPHIASYVGYKHSFFSRRQFRFMIGHPNTFFSYPAAGTAVQIWSLCRSCKWRFTNKSMKLLLQRKFNLFYVLFDLVLLSMYRSCRGGMV